MERVNDGLPYGNALWGTVTEKEAIRWIFAKLMLTVIFEVVVSMRVSMVVKRVLGQASTTEAGGPKCNKAGFCWKGLSCMEPERTANG